MKKILTIVDVQNDFLPGGSLAVSNSDRIIENINVLLKKNYDIVITTQDWHPENHISFAKTHGKEVGEEIEIDNIVYHLWPNHCVASTSGAEISSLLLFDENVIRTYKGRDQNAECYSGFSDTHIRIIDELEQCNENAVFDIAGIALDYCVYYTACDLCNYVIAHGMLDKIQINVLRNSSAAINEDNVSTLYSPLYAVNLI